MEIIISTHWIVFFNWLREILHLQYANHVHDATDHLYPLFLHIGFSCKKEKESTNKIAIPYTVYAKMQIILPYSEQCISTGDQLATNKRLNWVLCVFNDNEKY